MVAASGVELRAVNEEKLPSGLHNPGNTKVAVDQRCVNAESLM